MFIDITKLEIKENIPVPLYIRKKLVERFMGENPKEEFTPEIMMDYLKHTNIVANVRDMLELIPEGKEAEFKEAVLSAVERRKVAPINIPRIREIAERGGFLEDFKETHKLEKWVPHTAQNHRVFIAKSVDDLLENMDLTKHDYVVCDSDDFKISADASKIFIAKSNEDLRANPDLSGYGTVICDFEGKTEFADLTKLPKKMIIKGDIDWSDRDFEKLPDISESIVYESFDCCGCKNLTSLEGAPKEVGGKFDCRWCENLTSLEGAPKDVGGDFDCYGCDNLTSLKGAPEKVGGSFDCSLCDKLEESGIYILQDGQYYDLFNLPKDKEFVINGDLNLSEYEFEQLPDLTNVVVKGYFSCNSCYNLTSLEGAPKEVGGCFYCDSCENLTSLEGAPEKVGGCFYCRWCENLTSLEGAPKEVGGGFYCSECENLTSAKGLPMHIGGEIECDDELRPEIDKELEKRKKQTNQSILPPNGFSNSGR